MVLLGPVYLAGVVLVAGLLIYEPLLVKKDDLSNVNRAFFNVNGIISIGLMVFVAVDCVWVWNGCGMFFLNFKGMFLMSWIYLLTAGVFEVGFTTSLKLSDNSSKLWATIGWFCSAFFCDSTGCIGGWTETFLSLRRGWFGKVQGRFSAYPSQIQLSETRDEIGFECKLRLANSSYKSKK